MTIRLPKVVSCLHVCTRAFLSHLLSAFEQTACRIRKHVLARIWFPCCCCWTQKLIPPYRLVQMGARFFSLIVICCCSCASSVNMGKWRPMSDSCTPSSARPQAFDFLFFRYLHAYVCVCIRVCMRCLQYIAMDTGLIYSPKKRSNIVSSFFSHFFLLSINNRELKKNIRPALKS